ncbi:hypothetical protein ATE49_15295 [Elizabethkingia miricola]|nr:hypothetical protein [Elizabethkingia miricola]OBS12819.1 hypothetical protein ATE49_15295 [Elizabethkingia miricola]
MNEFKIRIVSNSDGEEVRLDNISLDAAESLKVFIDSLTGLAKTYSDYDGSSDIKLSLTEGSVITSLVIPEDDLDVIEDIKEITNNKSKNNERIKCFKVIQDRIKQNGLTYEVSLWEDGQYVDLTPKFKSKNFQTRNGKLVPLKYEILFITGEAFEAGGKSKTNIHISKGEDVFKITCSRQQAQKINVYSNVYLSVLKKWRKEDNIEYILIDNYLSEEKYDFYKSIHEEYKLCDSLNKFDFIHDKVVEIVNNDNLDNNELIKLMRLYNNQYSDRGTLRTLLMSIKPILHNNKGLKDYYNKVADRLRDGSSSKKI